MKPPHVAQVHRSICVRSKCEYLNKINYADECSFCPNGHFGQYKRSKCVKGEQPKARGLGDLIASVATPIARALKLPCIDPKTNQLRPESRCNKMRKRLNKL